MKRKLQLFRQRLDRRPSPLPRPFGLEAQIADAASPRSDHPADGAEVGAVGVLLIQPASDVWSDADERPQRGRRLDAVLAAVPGAVEDERDLLEVVDEELFGFFVPVRRSPSGE